MHNGAASRCLHVNKWSKLLQPGGGSKVTKMRLAAVGKLIGRSSLPHLPPAELPLEVPSISLLLANEV